MVSEKSNFYFSYVNDLGPRASNDHDLEYQYTFIYSISCLHLSLFRSHATIVSEILTVFTFSYTKTYVTKFDLAVKYVKVNPRLSFEQIMMERSPRCYIPSFMEISPLVPEIFEGFLTYMDMAAILVM